MPKTKVLVGKQEVEIETRPLTVIVPAANIYENITVPNAIEIGSPKTIETANSLTQRELDFLHLIGAQKLFDMVFKTSEITMPKKISEVKIAGDGVKHILGMITMIFSAIGENKKMYFKHPGTHLHPRAQIGLADMLGFLANPQIEPKEE